MTEQRTYQQPEIFEMGAAGALTLGDPLQPHPDNCGCKSKTNPFED